MAYADLSGNTQVIHMALWIVWVLTYSVGSMALAHVETQLGHVEAPWVPADSFGGRLALIRQRLHLNVAEAADFCGVNRETWRSWEHGREPRGLDRKARQIADSFGVDYVWLLTGQPSQTAIMTWFSASPTSEGATQLRLPLSDD